MKRILLSIVALLFACGTAHAALTNCQQVQATLGFSCPVGFYVVGNDFGTGYECKATGDVDTWDTYCTTAMAGGAGGTGLNCLSQRKSNAAAEPQQCYCTAPAGYSTATWMCDTCGSGYTMLTVDGLAACYDNECIRYDADKDTISTACVSGVAGDGDLYRIFADELAVWDDAPMQTFYDTSGDDADINAQIVVALTDTGTGAEDADVTLSQQIAGTMTAFLTADADGNVTIRDLVIDGPIIATGLSDADGDTMVQVEETADSDIVKLTSGQAKGVPVVVPRGATLLTDGGMEIWSDASNLTNWPKVIPGGTPTLEREAAVKHGGSYSAKMTGDSGTPIVISQLETGLTVGATYNSVYWARFNVAGDVVVVVMNDLFASATQIYRFSDDTWQTFTGAEGSDPDYQSKETLDATFTEYTTDSFTVPANGQIALSFVTDGNPASIYVDDVDLATPAGTAAADLVQLFDFTNASTWTNLVVGDTLLNMAVSAHNFLTMEGDGEMSHYAGYTELAAGEERYAYKIIVDGNASDSATSARGGFSAEYDKNASGGNDAAFSSTGDWNSDFVTIDKAMRIEPVVHSQSADTNGFNTIINGGNAVSGAGGAVDGGILKLSGGSDDGSAGDPGWVQVGEGVSTPDSTLTTGLLFVQEEIEVDGTGYFDTLLGVGATARTAFAGGAPAHMIISPTMATDDIALLINVESPVLAADESLKAFSIDVTGAAGDNADSSYLGFSLFYDPDGSPSESTAMEIDGAWDAAWLHAPNEDDTLGYTTIFSGSHGGDSTSGNNGVDGGPFHIYAGGGADGFDDGVTNPQDGGDGGNLYLSGGFYGNKAGAGDDGNPGNIIMGYNTEAALWGGNVGIGDLTPESKLDVEDEGNVRTVGLANFFTGGTAAEVVTNGYGNVISTFYSAADNSSSFLGFVYAEDLASGETLAAFRAEGNESGAPHASSLIYGFESTLALAVYTPKVSAFHDSGPADFTLTADGDVIIEPMISTDTRGVYITSGEVSSGGPVGDIELDTGVAGGGAIGGNILIGPYQATSVSIMTSGSDADITLGSGVAFALDIISGNHIATTDNFYIASSDDAGARTIQLPDTMTTDGRTFVIFDVNGDASTYPIEISPQTKTINGASEVYITQDWGWAIVTTDSSFDDWYAFGSGIQVMFTADQSVADNGTVVCNNEVTRVSGSAGGSTLDVDPAIADGYTDGYACVIQGTVDADWVEINDGDNVELAGGVDARLGKGDTLSIIWDTGESTWYETSRSNN